MGYRSDSIAISRDMGPLSLHPPISEFPRRPFRDTPRGILKKINLAWTLEIFKRKLENFNLAWIFQSRPSELPTKIGVWWAARLKFSISLENVIRFNLAWKFQSRRAILNLFKIWALWAGLWLHGKSLPEVTPRGTSTRSSTKTMPALRNHGPWSSELTLEAQQRYFSIQRDDSLGGS